jgi:phosphate transport system permease protein
MTTLAFGVMLAVALFGYIWNMQAARAIRDKGERLHSLIGYHALFSALVVVIPVFILILVWLIVQQPIILSLLISSLPEWSYEGLETGAQQLIIAEIQTIAGGTVFGTPDPWKVEAADRLNAMRDWSAALLVATVAVVAILLMVVSRRRVTSAFRARQGVEKIVMGLMIFCSVVAIFTTIGIVASLLFESIRFFRMVPITDFLFGLRFEPQMPLREDQIAAEGAFGIIPLALGTVVIMFFALLVAIPVGLFTAIYLNEFASTRFRGWAKPILEILAGVPTIVYGFFAILVVAPAIRSFGASIGLSISPNTALAAGSVMGIMLIPFISSFADDAIAAVPRSLRDGSLALGATRGETMRLVLFPAAIPGIAGGILLAVSKAIGETMIVVMAAGLIATLTINPLDSVTTITVQIMTLLVGDTAFDSPKTLAAFALGMVLFVVTLVINIFALGLVRKYREIYD